MERCAKCGKVLRSFSRTAYGENRCLDCFDDYLMTDKGKVEYLIGIVEGELDLKDYDADFLGLVAVCWNKYKEKLNLSIPKIIEIETKAEQLGIL
jgi:hypothetical protein